MTEPTYVRAVVTTAAQGLLTGTWVASGELAPLRRRAVRAGATAAMIGVGWVTGPDQPERTVTWSEDRGLVVREKDGTELAKPDRRRLVASGIAAAVAVGMTVGRRQLEKRWLARLRRAGHPHPHRALAVRISLLTMAVMLPKELIDVYEAHRRK
jgi:hypothetical protein